MKKEPVQPPKSEEDYPSLGKPARSIPMETNTLSRQFQPAVQQVKNKHMMIEDIWMASWTNWQTLFIKFGDQESVSLLYKYASIPISPKRLIKYVPLSMQNQGECVLKKLHEQAPVDNAPISTNLCYGDKGIELQTCDKDDNCPWSWLPVIPIPQGPQSTPPITAPTTG